MKLRPYARCTHISSPSPTRLGPSNQFLVSRAFLENVAYEENLGACR